MATQKPIATISYNSEGFLVEKLESWYKAHIIQAYMYICHKGEDGDKDHIHLRIVPNKKLDPMTLTDDLKEYPVGCKKPLGCRPWGNSKEEDWLLYAVHDKDYLNQKYAGGEKREKLPYSLEDIKASEGFDIEIAFIRAKSYLQHTSANIATRMKSGARAIDLIEQGENVFYVNQIHRALSLNDYGRLQAEFSSLRDEFDYLLTAVDNYGLKVVYDDNGAITLEKK